MGWEIIGLFTLLSDLKYRESRRAFTSPKQNLPVEGLHLSHVCSHFALMSSDTSLIPTKLTHCFLTASPPRLLTFSSTSMTQLFKNGSRTAQITHTHVHICVSIHMYGNMAQTTVRSGFSCYLMGKPRGKSLDAPWSASEYIPGAFPTSEELREHKTTSCPP